MVFWALRERMERGEAGDVSGLVFGGRVEIAVGMPSTVFARGDFEGDGGGGGSGSS